MILKFPKEKVMERFDALPEHIQQLLTTDELINTIWTIGEAHHLGEERTGKIASIIGAIILGFLHNEDLAKEITREARIDKRLADEIAHELQLKILDPLMPEINAAFSSNLRGVLSTTPTSTIEPAQPAIVRPVFAPPQQETGEGNQPFILHEERSEIEQVKPMDETLVRPSFYDPPSREASEGQREQERGEREAARLEIGGAGKEKAREPRVGKTETEKIRVVHYSGPQTPVDPFNPETRDQKRETRMTEPPQSQQDIHPENIVDLKDLPK